MALLTTGTESTTQVYEIIHDFYWPEVIDQWPIEVLLYGKLPKKKVSGRQYLIKYDIGRNQAGGFYAERAALPSAKGRLFKEGSDNTKYFYVPFDITGQEIHETSSPDQFINVVDHAFKTTYDSAVAQYNRALWGDGSGRLGQINGTPTYSATTGLTTIVVDNCSMHNFFRYEDINVHTDTTAFSIKKIDVANNTIYVGGDTTSYSADDRWLYASGAYDSGLYTQCLGLKGHVSDSDTPASEYQGLNRATTGYEFLQSYVKDMSTAAISTLDLTQFYDEIDVRSGGKQPNLNITERGVRNSIVLLMESRHQNFNPVVEKWGFAEILKFTYAGQPRELVILNNCPEGDLYALNTQHLWIAESKPLGWNNTMGTDKVTWKQGYDIYEGIISSYFNTVCDFNQSLGKMTDIKRNSIT